MAVVTKTLKTSGGDYSSLSAWEAGEQTDLVTAGDSHVLECDAGTYIGDVTIAGWTTSASNRITIKAAAGSEHNGVRGAGVKFTVDNFSNDATIDCEVDFLTFLDVEIEQTEFRSAIKLGGVVGGCYAKRCILSGDSSGGGNVGGGLTLNDTNIENMFESCLIIQSRSQTSSGAVRYNRGSLEEPQFYNCTFVGDIGAYGTGSSAYLMPFFQNCAFATEVDACTAAGGETYRSGVSHNAFWTGTTAFGTNQVTGIGSSDFENYVAYGGALGDYSIDATSSLYDVGTDLSAEFTADIANTTITDWSIGAYTFVSAATPTDITPGLQNLGRQFATISAHRLGGVLQ